MTLEQIIDGLVSGRGFRTGRQFYQLTRLEIDMLADAYLDNGDDDLAAYVKELDYFNLYGNRGPKLSTGWASNDWRNSLRERPCRRTGEDCCRQVQLDFERAMAKAYPQEEVGP